MATDKTVIVNLPVSVQTLRDLLCTAVEGGSTYWASFYNAERTEDLDYLKVRVTEHEASGSKRRNVYVTAEDLARGIERLAEAASTGKFRDGTEFPAASKHLGDALGDHDATHGRCGSPDGCIR